MQLFLLLSICPPRHSPPGNDLIPYSIQKIFQKFDFINKLSANLGLTQLMRKGEGVPGDQAEGQLYAEGEGEIYQGAVADMQDGEQH